MVVEFLRAGLDADLDMVEAGFFQLVVQDLAVLTFGLVLTGIGVVLMIIIGHYPSRRV